MGVPSQNFQNGDTKPKFPKIDFHDLAAVTGFTLWFQLIAQANPAAQTKLERAQRSYNETSRGWDSPPAQSDLVGQI